MITIEDVSECCTFERTQSKYCICFVCKKTTEGSPIIKIIEYCAGAQKVSTFLEDSRYMKYVEVHKECFSDDAGEDWIFEE